MLIVKYRKTRNKSTENWETFIKLTEESDKVG